jgi:uncharacterized protein
MRTVSDARFSGPGTKERSLPARVRTSETSSGFKIAAIVAAAIVTAVMAVDGASMAIGAIHLYQRLVAPVTARLGMRCRFTPSCSHYGEQIIAREGLLLGGLKTARRVAQCGPWTLEGTEDRP